MSETTTGPTNTGGSPPPPPPRPDQDLDRLRRSTSDRYLAGVAGGLGRHFGIDPTVIRVLLAVLAFFGGAGVLIYGVCWLFVPEDGSERAPIHVGPELRRLLLLAAAALAFVFAMGDAFSGFNAGWPIAALAIVVAVVLIVRDRRDDGGQNPPAALIDMTGAAMASDGSTPAPAAYPAAYPVAPAAAPSAAAGYAAVAPAPVMQTAPGAPTWQPPRPPVIPPRPKRTGIIWFWPTLALIAIALGVLGVIDAGSTHIAAWGYPAVAVAITGLMLVIGSVVGRPGGLVLLGLISTLALVVATVMGGFDFRGRDVDLAPTSAAEVQSVYSAPNGRILLDLSTVTDPQLLAGRSLHLTLGAGQIRVIVPRSLNVEIHAKFDFAGGIIVPGYDGGGYHDSVDRHLSGTPATTTPDLELNLDANVGQITVEQR